MKAKEFRRNVQRSTFTRYLEIVAPMSRPRSREATLKRAAIRPDRMLLNVAARAMQMPARMRPMKFKRCDHNHIAVTVNSERGSVLFFVGIVNDQQTARLATGREHDNAPLVGRANAKRPTTAF